MLWSLGAGTSDDTQNPEGKEKNEDLPPNLCPLPAIESSQMEYENTEYENSGRWIFYLGVFCLSEHVTGQGKQG